MASWLKAAEDLFEVVDRRAKLAAGDKPEEQVNLQTPVTSSHFITSAEHKASNGRGSQAKRTRPKTKPQKQLASQGTSVPGDTEMKQAIQEISQAEVVSEKDMAIPVTESSGIASQGYPGMAVEEDNRVTDSNGSTGETSSSGNIVNEELKDDAGHAEEAATSQREVETSQDNVSDAHEGSPSLPARDLEIVPGDPPIDASQNTILEDTRSHVNIRQEGPQISSADSLGEADTQVKDVDLQAESVPDQPRHPQPSTVISAEKVQEQLDEAQGLLKNAVSTGQSKEARLARICAGLSSRLQEYKSENAQLEELLTAERELSKSYERRIEQLQKDLSVSKSEVTRVESSMADALGAKNAEIEALVNSLDGSKRQAAFSEGNLASLQANMETIMRNRELTETRMMHVTLNGRQLFGQPIKVNWAYTSAQREDTSNHFNIFVGDLSPEVTDATLYACFSVYSTCSDARVMWDQKTGRSRGFGFVSFRSQQEAQNAINDLTGKWLGSRQIRCNWAAKGAGIGDDKQSSDAKSVVELTNGTSEDGQEKTGEDTPDNNVQYTTVYVGNLAPEVTSADLHRHFHFLGAGVIEDVRVQRDKGFGFVRFSNHAEAARAIQLGNARILFGKAIKCSWGSKPTPPGTSSAPLPPPAVAHMPGFSAAELVAYERQLALSKMAGAQALMHPQGQRIGAASQAIYDGGYAGIAATTQPPMYYQ